MNSQYLLYNKDKYITKQIIVFLNGSPNHSGKKIKINSSITSKWHHILNEITRQLNPSFGKVKKLYSAESGISLNSISDLKNNGKYVASDNTKFQDVEGGYNTKNEKTKPEYMEHYNTDQLNYVNKLKKLSEIRPNLIVIFVYINGRNRDLPQKFVLAKDELHKWEQCLSYIASVLDMPSCNIQFLYDTKGHRVCGPWELQHGATYIAVGYNQKFIKREYSTWLHTIGKMKSNIPIIKKDKNLPCFHKNNYVNSWKQNINWKTYVEKGFLESVLYDTSNIFKNKNHFIEDIPNVNIYSCKCLYYKVEKEQVILNSDNKYQKEKIENYNRKGNETGFRKINSESAVEYNNDIWNKEDSCKRTLSY